MIVYACSDLFFATRIRSTAESLGVVSRPARDAHALAQRLDRVDDGKAHDPVAAVLIDLDRDDAVDLIRHAKAHAAAPVVVAFGSHVATATLDAARAAGADHVMPRSAFTARLPDLLDAYR